MDTRPIVWDKFNRRHIEKDHPERRISVAEVVQVLYDPNRIEGREKVRRGQLYHPVLGRTEKGRLLYIVYVDDPRGPYPVHAREAARQTQRRLRSEIQRPI